MPPPRPGPLSSTGPTSLPRQPFSVGDQRQDVTKVSPTIRLDPNVIAALKAQGAGWPSRISDALRKAAGP